MRKFPFWLKLSVNSEYGPVVLSLFWPQWVAALVAGVTVGRIVARMDVALGCVTGAWIALIVWLVIYWVLEKVDHE